MHHTESRVTYGWIELHDEPYEALEVLSGTYTCID